MKTFKAKIDFGSLTGKSGINLDELGYISDDNNVICWVIDGVSPLIFSKKHAWQFRKFSHAGNVLNKSFKQANWDSVNNTFSEITKTIKDSINKPLFLSGAFFHWPLFSCGLVKIEQQSNTINLALYGDCVIIIQRGDSFEKYEYRELEDRKDNINKLFKIFDTYLNSYISKVPKKILFAVIRIQQIWFGKSRVLSVKKHFPPAVSQVVRKYDIDNIVILSDGVSWYIKNNDENMTGLMNSIHERGVGQTLTWLRSMEELNTDFGKYDDATIISIKM